MLAIAITVSAIIVELAATRYNYRITWLFVSEPINIAAMSLFVVTTLQCVWVGVSRTTGETAHLPGAAFGVTLVLVTVCLLMLLPYFTFVFRFLSPLSIIEKIKGSRVQVRAARAPQFRRGREASRDGGHRRVAGRGAQRDRTERSQHCDGVRRRAQSIC